MTSIVTSLPLVLALATPWLVPESARWLMSQGKVEKAIGILRKFEKINGTKVPEDIYEEFKVNWDGGIIASKKIVYGKERWLMRIEIFSEKKMNLLRDHNRII